MGALPNLLLDTAVAVPDATASQAPAATLAVNIPTQDQDQWCWCAVTVGVSAFLDPAFALTQCQTAALVLSIPDACDRPGDDDVDVMFALDTALAKFNHLNATVGGRLTFDQVCQQIDARKPVCVRMLFLNSGEAHFMVIRGYRSDPVQMVANDDSRYGQSIWPFASFADGYQGSGSWKQSYLTR